MWACWLLRLVAESPRNAACSRVVAPDHPLARARRRVVVVLRRRDRLRARGRHGRDAHPAFAPRRLAPARPIVGLTTFGCEPDAEADQDDAAHGVEHASNTRAEKERPAS